MTSFTMIQIRSDARADTTEVSGYAAETIMLAERKRMERDLKVIAYHIFMDGEPYAAWPQRGKPHEQHTATRNPGPSA